eukprot:gene4625-5067_t
MKKKDFNLSQWESRYGEIVFAKSGTFPWWPSCIVDPRRLREKRAVIAKGVNHIGRLYTVYYYADNTVGFVGEKSLRVYDEQSKQQLSGQSLGDYANLYPEAIARADADLLLEARERVAWCTEPLVEASRKSPEVEEEEVEVVEEEERQKKKRGRPPKKKAEVVLTVTESTAETKPEEKEEAGEVEGKEEEVVVVEEEEEELLEESEASSDFSEPKPRRGSGRGSGSDRGRKRLLVNLKRTSTGRGRGRPPKKTKQEEEQEGEQEQEEEVVAVSARKKARRRSRSDDIAPPPPPGSAKLFDEESRSDRLVRLVRILQSTTSPEALDLPRALKTLDKLDQVDFSLAELKETGVARVVKALAKGHANADLRSRAQSLYLKFQQQAQTLQTATSSSSTTTAAAVVVVPRDTTVEIATAVSPEEVKAAEVVIPETIQQNPVRLRAVRLLREGLEDLSLAIGLEEALQATFATKPTYFESLARFYSLCKSMKEESREIVRQGLANNTRALLYDTFELSTIY